MPILGPDIIDPRQMDLIRRQAELAAQGKPYAVREIPEAALKRQSAKLAPKAKPQIAATAGGDAGDDPEKAARLAKREAALARKKAEGGEAAAPAAVAEAAAPAATGEKKAFDKAAMLEKIRAKKGSK